MFSKGLLSKLHDRKMDSLDYSFLIAGLTVFVPVTLWTITKFSFWFDEAFGAYLIRFNFLDIAKYTAADVHPPLYYWLLKAWSMLFGNGELALRSMSILFGCIAIIFAYLLTRRLLGNLAARVSILLIAVSPMLVRYGQEARMYTLVAAIALAATYILTFAINSKKRLPWIVYGILVGLGMLTHYFVAIVWLSHWAWRIISVYQLYGRKNFFKQFFTKNWIIAHIVAIGVFLPWMPFFINQVFIVQSIGFWIPPVTPDTIINFLTNFLFYLDVSNVNGWLSLIFIAIIILVTALAVRVYKGQDTEQRQAYALIMTLAFVPIILLFIMSIPPLRSIFIDRYLITSSIAIVIFIGSTMALGAKYIPKNWRAIAIMFVTVFMVIGFTNVWRLGNYNKNTKESNNTRQIIELVKEKSSSDQPIIAATPWLFYEAVFYADDEHKVYFIGPKEYIYGSLDMLKNNDQFKIKDVSSFTNKNPVIWYVGYIKDGDFKVPYSTWKPVQEIIVNDSVDSKPAYKAVQYSTLD